MSKTTKKDEMLETTPEPAALVDAPAPAQPPPLQPPPDPTGRQTIEHWCETLGTPSWLFAGTKLGKGWPIGKEVTRAEYEAAVKWAAHEVTCR